jgi:branched-chain amino acid transport system ATP-binding protein
VTPVIEVRDLTAGYGSMPVVRGVTFSVESGQVVALLGPNGAGKTTTLLTVAGFLDPMSGDVQVLGVSGSARRPQALVRRGLAFVPEDRGLASQLTVGECLRLRSRRCSTAIEDVLGLLPALVGLANRRVGLLSGGEQQMLALAAAIAAEPRVLVIDEMSLGLAPVIVDDLLPIVRHLACARDVGVLLVEQHIHGALTVADVAHVLHNGEIVLSGASELLLAHPDDLHAAYLGTAPSSPGS